MHRCFKQLAPEAGEAEGGDTHSRAPEGGTLTYQAERQRDTHLPHSYPKPNATKPQMLSIAC
jgi:hypothetical protein